MICFTSNPSIFSSIPIYSSISSITNNPNCVLFSMAPANTVSGYYDIRKFIITANNILQHSGTNIGSGISYIDPMVSNIIFETPDFDKDLAGCIDYDVNLWISMMLIMIHAYEGYEVIIAGAGLAAHLPGVIASMTVLPVTLKQSLPATAKTTVWAYTDGGMNTEMNRRHIRSKTFLSSRLSSLLDSPVGMMAW